MSVDAGSIYSEVRIKLDALRTDIKSAESAFDQMGEEFARSASNYSDKTGKKYQTALKSIADEIDSVKFAQKASAISETEAITKLIALRKEELKVLQNRVIKEGEASQDTISAINKTKKAINDLEKAQSALATQPEKIKTKWTDLFSKVNLLGVAAFAAVTMAVKKAVSIFGDYEQSMANVQSAARASAKDLALLEKAAMDAGEQTRFSASQAADALYYLSSAGLNAKQSAAALDGVLKLAGATQSDLASTSATVTATLSQFGLQAEESARVANVFTAAIVQSQADMPKLANSLVYVGTIAGQLNIPLEEVTANLEALYNKGYKGEQAGTALRAALGDLADSTSSASKTLKKYGIDLDDVNPKTVGLTGAIQAIGKANLTTGQYFEIFGKETAGSISALVSLEQQSKKGTSTLRDMQAALTGTNAAAEAYATQNNTLNGRIDEFSSALEGLAIRLIKMVSPALRGLLELGTNIILGFTKWISGNSRLEQAQNILDKSTNDLKKSVDEYKKANEELNDKTKILNETEKNTISNRKDLYSIDIKKNLQKTIESFEILDREQEKANKGIENRKEKIDKLNKLIPKQMEEIIKLEKKIAAGEIFNSAGVAIYPLLTDARLQLKKLDDELKLNTTELYKNQALLTESNENEKNKIKVLAELVNAEGLAINEIALYNKEIANRIETNSKELKQNYLVIDMAKKLASGLITEKDLNALNNKELIDRIKKEAELIKLKQKEAEIKSSPAANTEDKTKANEKLTESLKNYEDELKKTNATEIEKLNIDKKREIEEINLSAASSDIKQKNIDLINKTTNAKIEKIKRDEQEKIIEKALADNLKDKNEIDKEILQNAEEQKKIDDSILKIKDEYNDKIDKTIKANKNLITSERDKAIESIMASGASADAQEQAIQAIYKYYDALEKKESFNKFIANIKDIAGYAQSAFEATADLITSLIETMTEKTLAALDEQMQKELENKGLLEETTLEKLQNELDYLTGAKQETADMLDAELQKELEAKGLSEQTTLEKLQTELNAALLKNDKEKAAEIQKEIEREKLITDYEAKKTEAAKQELIREKNDEIEKEKIRIEFEKKKAQAEYEGALQTWYISKAIAITQGIVAIMNGLAVQPFPVGLVMAGVAGVAAAANLIGLEASKPPAPKFITGGLVIGSGSSQGTNAIVAEGGSNELMLNNSQQGRGYLNEFADLIVERMGTALGDKKAISELTIIMNLDSVQIAKSTANVMNNAIVTLDARAIQQ